MGKKKEIRQNIYFKELFSKVIIAKEVKIKKLLSPIGLLEFQEIILIF